MNVTEQSDVARYVDEVRAALSDLPEAAREELLEELPDHLAEVAAEGEGTLEQRLGPPAAYAAELRATAEVAAAGRSPSGNTAARRRDAANRLDRRLGRLLGYGRASEFGRLLRPAWWMLRGYVVAMLFFAAFARDGFGLLPPDGQRVLVWLVVVAVAVVASVRLGTAAARWRGWPAVAAVGANLLLAGILVAAAVSYSQRVLFIQPEPPVVSYEAPAISDVKIFPYDRQGRPLRDVRLVDESGHDLYLGDLYDCPGVDGTGRTLPLYPACGRDHPFPRLNPLPEPAPTAAPAPTASSPSVMPPSSSGG